MTPAQWVSIALFTTAVIYAVTATAYQIGARPGMALTFAGYTVAQLGLIWDALSNRAV